MCRASLLDDEAIVSAVENFSEKSLVGHHFLVQVKYDGRKAISEQEIIIERQVSGAVFSSDICFSVSIYFLKLC